MYRFKEESALCKYLEHAFPSEKFVGVDLEVGKLLLRLNDICRRLRLEDPTNQSVFFLDNGLEKALGVKFLHQCQLKRFVLKQLERHGPGGEIVVETVVEGTPCSTITLPEKCYRKVYPHERFELKEAFRSVLVTLPGVHHNQKFFEFGELQTLLNQYLDLHKSKMLDQRNEDVYYCKHTLLGSAFKVNTFHKNQIMEIIGKHCVPRVSTYPHMLI